MKKFTSNLVAFVAMLALAAMAFAQTYPVTSPSYTPTAVLAPATLSAPGDYSFNIGGVNAATVRISGTCTSLAAAVQGTNDGTNWTTVPVTPVAGGAAVTSLTGTGFWRANTAGFTKTRVHVTALSASCTFAMAATPGFGLDTVSVVQNSTIGDPCQNPSIAKSSAIVNVGAATTTKIVDTLNSTTVYVCGFSATLAGTTPTVVFKTGTKTTNDCDTGAASLTGTYAPTSGNSLEAYGAGTVMKSISGGQICATTTGTGSSFQGVLTYVQQ